MNKEYIAENTRLISEFYAVLNLVRGAMGVRSLEHKLTDGV